MTKHKNKKPEQKLISFRLEDNDFTQLERDIKEGWAIVSLYSGDKGYVGIMEKKTNEEVEGDIYIPPRKKIKFNH
ncbi:MAG: DUF2674 domain-containing protein [Rickettsiaceae bacterium]|nr:DUF2674 domain-containing protein [Rickettsiaceae bacterium]